MEFETKAEEYNVAAFVDMFGHRFPQIVMITGGFCGEIIADTFDYSQILIIQTKSRQRRVVAKSEYRNQTQLYSIPVNYQPNLCVVKKHGKVGKEKSLLRIITGHSLPISVKFPKDSKITIGNQTICTNHIPVMHLTEVFDEVSLLGNFMINGTVSEDVVHVPLYLSQLRVAIVTGIKGQSRDTWFNYVEEANRKCANIEYDVEFGNPDIAVYNPKAIHSDTVYSYVEPTKYATIANLFNKTTINNQADAAGTYDTINQHYDVSDLYDTISNPSEDIPSVNRFKTELSDALQRKTQVTPQLTPPPLIPRPRIVQQTSARHIPTSSAIPGTLQQTSTRPIPPSSASPEPLQQTPTKTEQLQKTSVRPIPPPPTRPGTSQQTTSDTNVNTAPMIPERNKRISLIKTAEKPTRTKAPAQIYVNELPPEEVSPLARNSAANYPETGVIALNPELQNTARQVEIKSTALPVVTNASDVAKLTIHELLEYLKLLKLEKYVRTFQNELIDGDMLVDLDKDTLKEEFGFTTVEALRLVKFANNGHVPM